MIWPGMPGLAGALATYQPDDEDRGAADGCDPVPADAAAVRRAQTGWAGLAIGRATQLLDLGLHRAGATLRDPLRADPVGDGVDRHGELSSSGLDLLLQRRGVGSGHLGILLGWNRRHRSTVVLKSRRTAARGRTRSTEAFPRRFVRNLVSCPTLPCSPYGR